MENDRHDSTAVIRSALAEDIGDGDVTTDSIFGPERFVRGSFVAKADGIIAGLDVAAEVFRSLDTACRFVPSCSDGDPVNEGGIIAEVTGPARAILRGERTALNFLQRMSGIATRTNAFVSAVAGTGCIILDTRKTAPGLRILDKQAVRVGGGTNHRMGLFDMVLIKDNHIDAAGSITKAVGLVRSGPHARIPIEVECRTLQDVSEALSLDVDRILLDNMSLGNIREAVELTAGRTPLEVSGNVSLDTVRSYAEAGVQFVSVGALTHSVQALDISLEVRPEPAGGPAPRGHEAEVRTS